MIESYFTTFPYERWICQLQTNWLSLTEAFTEIGDFIDKDFGRDDITKWTESLEEVWISELLR